MDTLDPKYLWEKLNVVFESLRCATQLIVAFSFVLKNVEDVSCRFYYALEKITPLERSKFVATTEDLTKIKSLLSNTDFFESSTREPTYTKWKFFSGCRTLQVSQHYSNNFRWAAKTLFPRSTIEKSFREMFNH